MTSQDDHRFAGLFPRLVLGVAWFAAVGVVRALWSGDNMAERVAEGAVLGLAAGAMWHFEHRRGVKYRRRLDPAQRTLIRPVGATGVPPEKVRHRHSRWLPTIFACGLGLAAVLGFGVLRFEDGAMWQIGVLAAIALGSCYGLWAWRVTYTEVGQQGVTVRTPRRTRTIAWPDLAEVRWHRTDSGDTLLFVARDGREVESVGAQVSSDGSGEQRLVQLQIDVERAWAHAG